MSSRLEYRTQNALRYSMFQRLRPSDGPGYIYALELAGTCCGKWTSQRIPTFLRIDASRPDLIHIKVGRSIDVHTRFNHHRNRCPSSQQKLLGQYPSPVRPPQAIGVKYCDRLERLVHIELAELSAKSYPPARGSPCQPCVDC